MDSKTLKALKGSIKKWEKIVDGTGGDYGGDNCPLCDLVGIGDCIDDCPVAIKTGFEDCGKTPYTEWIKHQQEMHKDFYPYIIKCPECKKLAKAELKFLKSLLPKEKKC